MITITPSTNFTKSTIHPNFQMHHTTREPTYTVRPNINISLIQLTEKIKLKIIQYSVNISVVNEQGNVIWLYIDR